MQGTLFCGVLECDLYARPSLHFAMGTWCYSKLQISLVWNFLPVQNDWRHSDHAFSFCSSIMSPISKLLLRVPFQTQRRRPPPVVRRAAHECLPWLFGPYRLPTRVSLLSVGFPPGRVAADACVKMSANQMTTVLADAPRPKVTPNLDMSTLLLKLSLLSAVFFSERVQFVLGHLEAVGRTPAWVSPSNRRAERGVKTERAVAKKSNWNFKDDDHAKLVDALREKGGGISQVETMTMDALQHLHKAVFGTKGTRWLSLLSASLPDNVIPLVRYAD